MRKEPQVSTICDTSCLYRTDNRLDGAMRNMLGKPESDMRRRRPLRDAVPADSTFTRHLLMGTRMMMIADKDILGLTRQVPRQGCQQHQGNQRGGNNHHIPTAIVSPIYNPISLNTYHHSHIDHRNVTRHHITSTHIEQNKKNKALGR